MTKSTLYPVLKLLSSFWLPICHNYHPSLKLLSSVVTLTIVWLTLCLLFLGVRLFSSYPIRCRLFLIVCNTFLNRIPHRQLWRQCWTQFQWSLKQFLLKTKQCISLPLCIIFRKNHKGFYLPSLWKEYLICVIPMKYINDRLTTYFAYLITKKQQTLWNIELLLPTY